MKAKSKHMTVQNIARAGRAYTVFNTMPCDNCKFVTGYINWILAKGRNKGWNVSGDVLYTGHPPPLLYSCWYCILIL